MKLLNRNLLGAAIFAFAATASGLVYASTAANTTITNTATVNFEDASNNPQPEQTASVSLTVNLVASAPIITSPADIDPSAENTLEQLTYFLTSTANGLDTYDFSSVDSRTNMDADAAFSTPAATLGATTVADAITVGATTITVPYDGADDNNVNGIVAGDILVIDPTGTAEVVEVASVDESGGANDNVVTITLVDPTASAHAVGVIIGERQEVVLDVTTSTVTTGVSGTHSVVTTATSQEDATVSASQATATGITVRKPVLAVTKYVRNVTDTTLTGADPVTIGGTTWYTSGVSGNPGQTMEYLIVVDNSDADAGVANNIVVSDPIPQFTSFVAGSVQLDTTGDDTFVAQNEAVASGSAAELDTSGNGTLYVYAGDGGEDTGAVGDGDGGTLQPGEVSRVIFRVTID